MCREVSAPGVAFIALNTDGGIGAMSLQKGFNYALARDGTNELIEAEYIVR